MLLDIKFGQAASHLVIKYAAKPASQQSPTKLFNPHRIPSFSQSDNGNPLVTDMTNGLIFLSQFVQKFSTLKHLAINGVLNRQISKFSKLLLVFGIAVNNSRIGIIMYMNILELVTATVGQPSNCHVTCWQTD